MLFLDTIFDHFEDGTNRGRIERGGLYTAIMRRECTMDLEREGLLDNMLVYRGELYGDAIGRRRVTTTIEGICAKLTLCTIPYMGLLYANVGIKADRFIRIISGLTMMNDIGGGIRREAEGAIGGVVLDIFALLGSDLGFILGNDTFYGFGLGNYIVNDNGRANIGIEDRASCIVTDASIRRTIGAMRLDILFLGFLGSFAIDIGDGDGELDLSFITDANDAYDTMFLDNDIRGALYFGETKDEVTKRVDVFRTRECRVFLCIFSGLAMGLERVFLTYTILDGGAGEFGSYRGLISFFRGVFEVL